jgi:hypothetical protein
MRELTHVQPTVQVIIIPGRTFLEHPRIRTATSLVKRSVHRTILNSRNHRSMTTTLTLAIPSHPTCNMVFLTHLLARKTIFSCYRHGMNNIKMSIMLLRRQLAMTLRILSVLLNISNQMQQTSTTQTVIVTPPAHLTKTFS